MAVSATWALLPLKSFRSAKQRLAGVLTPLERQQLFRAMVDDVVATLTADPQIEQVWIVSDDPDAEQLAAQNGIQWVAESFFADAQGLNGVVQQATKWLTEQGAQSLLIVHGDLPLLHTNDLAVMHRRQANLSVPSLVLATDRAGDSSNVLLLTPPTGFTFHYGVGSRHKHTVEAAEAGYCCEVLQRPGLACDVDNLDDLLVLLQECDSTRAVKSAAYLQNSGIADRILAAGADVSPGHLPKR